MPGKQIEGLFRRSSSLVPTPSLFDALTVFFGLSSRDIHIFNHDRVSAYEASVGFCTDHPDVSRRMMEHQRRDFVHYLQGRNLVFVMERFKKNLASELSAAPEVGHGYGRIPDLFSFLSNLILRSNVEALYGEHLLRICPTFCQDFWNFYKAFPNISKDNDELRDVEYEPIWGTQYVRKMIQRHEALGISDNGVAVVMLGYFFVAMANTVPAALWMILHILLDPSLLRQVRHRINPASQSTGAGEEPDIRILVKDPFLNSIYYETLRLRVASTVGHRSLDDQLCLSGGWKVKSGIPIMFTGWLAGLDESCWNTGQDLPSGDPEHPLNAFWAERFLDCPGSSSMSGPAKRKRVQPARESPQKPTTRSGTEDTRSKASVAGLQGHFFPFGGGAFRCPGEALAKHVVFASVAMVLQTYDLRLVDPDEAGNIQPGHRELPFGLHSFDRPVPVEICKLLQA
ncbi:nacht ankyrin [Fusarium globosum]|uniref:Nacht ankyrin n=1 Tax=Fusarium globosum TaxID=78864 RepID=A0A8H5YCW7_9HYPO|nr:nacht ankyrin [Fusarium globosum]